MRSLLFLFFVFEFFGMSAYGQTKKEVVVVESVGGATCEAVTAAVDSFVQNTKLEKAIIGIHFLGKDENRAGLDTQRVRTLREYFSKHLRNTPYFRDDMKIILGSSDKRSDKGRVDLFVDGDLMLRIEFHKNDFLALSECTRGNP